MLIPFRRIIVFFLYSTTYKDATNICAEAKPVLVEPPPVWSIFIVHL